MSNSHNYPPTRTIELEITILATPAEIWDALATTEGLCEWLLPIAEGGGAPGAELLLSWGEGIDWRARITAWDKNRHLRWSDPPKIDPDASTAPTPVAIDWRIEKLTSGRCVVRLVHFGLGANTESNGQDEANKERLTYFLFHLRQYLERHLHSTRVAINERRLSTIPRPELWARLLGPASLNATTHGTKGIRAGDRLSFTMEKGRPLSFIVGRVEQNICWGTVESLNDALLLIELEPGRSEYHFGIYLSVYDLPRRDVEALRGWIAGAADAAIA